MNATHTPIVLLGAASAETLAGLRSYLAELPGQAPQQDLLQAPIATEPLSPALGEVLALRASHFAHGHTVQADLQGKRPGQLARWGRDYLGDAIDLLNRGPAERARARTKLSRAAALILAELDRLDAHARAEPFNPEDGAPA